MDSMKAIPGAAHPSFLAGTLYLGGGIYEYLKVQKAFSLRLGGLTGLGCYLGAYYIVNGSACEGHTVSAICSIAVANNGLYRLIEYRSDRTAWPMIGAGSLSMVYNSFKAKEYWV